MSEHCFERGEITEMDLALYAEGLLAQERIDDVERFLEENPQFRIYCSRLDESVEDLVDYESFLPAGSSPSENCEDDAGADTARSVAAGFPQAGMRGSRWSAGLKPAAISLVLLLLALLGWRQNTLNAWDRGMQNGRVSILLSGQSAVPHVVRRARRALEELQSGFWVSGEQVRARDYELAAVLVTQAALEMNYYTIADYAADGDTFPPLQLCRKARQLLQPQQKVSELLAELCSVEGEIEFQLGMEARANRDRQLSVEWLRLSALTFLEGIRQARVSADSVRELKMSARLMKALHKGAAGDGVLTLELRRWLEGGSSPELLEEIGRVFPNQKIGLEELRALLQQSLSREEALRLSFKEWSASLKVELCWSIIDQNQSESPEVILSLMDICNTIGIGFHSVEEPLQEVIPALHLGIAFGDKLPTDFRNRPDALLVSCRLHGNLADAYEYLGERDRAIESRARALTAARSLLLRNSDTEARRELGWLTGRQLCSVFLQCVDNDGDWTEVDRLLGSMLQITGDLSSMSGFQLSRSEEECLRLIRDLRNNAVDTPPVFSETRWEVEMLLQQRSEASAPRLLQPYLDQLQDRIRILLRIPEFAESPQLQQLARTLAEETPVTDSSTGSF